ncbi:MAG: CHASE3 domain-containing protein [Rubrivivax sp.]|nr:CHASE3 domain-containing protein [Rubrivivax sp.]MDP3085985.1 CHASE3 domain-containing protein [Rubrivivax sp.]
MTLSLSRLFLPLQHLLARRWVGPLVVVLAAAVLLINEAGYQSTEHLARQRDRAVEVQLSIGELRRNLLRMETAVRGFMLTGRAGYRQPFDSANREVQHSIDTLRRLAQEPGPQAAALTELAEAATRRLSEAREVMSLYASGQTSAATELLLTDIGREYMERFSQLGETVLAAQREVVRVSGARHAQVRWWSRLAIAALVLLCLLALYAAARIARDRAAERARHLAELQAERDKLDDQVQERTSELTDLAQHLQGVREHERSHLARELHDELGGLLTAAKLNVARVRKRAAPASAELADCLQHLSQTLDDGIALKRRIIEDLRPSSLDHLGLKRTLEIQCAEFAERADLPVAAEVQDLQLSAERALVAFRVVQESLTNIAKYAQARQVRVSLTLDAGQALLRVEDDGKGFDPRQLAPGSHGLTGMRYRVQGCGGRLQLHSKLDQGTVISATLPL